MRKLFVCFIPILLVQLGDAVAQEREYINPRTASGEGLPFSGAVMVDDTLYLSGVLGLVDGKPPADPAEEAKLALTAMQNILKQADMTMDDLVQVQIFCSDVSQYSVFNEVYRTFFSKEFPARAFIGSGPLLFGARFEVQGIAVKRP
jgi:enamine deaminase RidA (YjgF/YER057c/UK114 family)